MPLAPAKQKIILMPACPLQTMLLPVGPLRSVHYATSPSCNLLLPSGLPAKASPTRPLPVLTGVPAKASPTGPLPLMPKSRLPVATGLPAKTSPTSSPKPWTAPRSAPRTPPRAFADGSKVAS